MPIVNAVDDIDHSVWMQVANYLQQILLYNTEYETFLWITLIWMRWMYREQNDIRSKVNNKIIQ